MRVIHVCLRPSVEVWVLLDKSRVRVCFFLGQFWMPRGWQPGSYMDSSVNVDGFIKVPSIACPLSLLEGEALIWEKGQDACLWIHARTSRSRARLEPAARPYQDNEVIGDGTPASGVLQRSRANASDRQSFSVPPARQSLLFGRATCARWRSLIVPAGSSGIRSRPAIHVLSQLLATMHLGTGS